MAANLDEILGRYVKNILDAMPAGVFISDISGRTLYINRVYEQLTGLSLGELEGKNVRSLVEEGIFDFVLNPEIVRTGKPVTHVQKIKNGKRLVLSGIPVFDEGGVLRLVVTFARDITLLSDLQNQVDKQHRLIAQINDQLAHMAQENNPPQIVYKSKRMQETMELLERFAPTDVTVLIQGETGVGKEVFSHLVHTNSLRKDKVMLKVDCGGISETLTESELFGYMPGAFTGASSKGKAGYFELAEGGTIFLDEIGELPLTMQTRLLRFLQEGEIVRVGSSTPRKVNVRVIAATNRDLGACVENGTFRRDLFYRLNVANLHIAPLRERVEDIRPLAEFFLRQYTAKYHKTMAFMNITLDMLETYPWPGNVRELQNMIHSLAVSLNSQLISPADLPSQVSGRAAVSCPEDVYSGSRSLKEIMAEKEKEFLERAIEVHGSVQKVAELFKINRCTIFRKLRGG